VHRHTSHEHEHEFEPERGLPEPLPPGEHVLWQGAPDWRALARECFHVRKLAVYFAALVLWRTGSVIASGSSVVEVAIAGAVATGLATVAIGLAALMAWMSARTSLYTITDRRIVMRVGIVLSATFNLPFSKVDSAGLHPLKDDEGDIALTLDKGSRIAYLHLWPHVRPWHVAHPQPALRCVPGAAEAGRILTGAWKEERGDLAIAAAAVAPARIATGRELSSARPSPSSRHSDRSVDAAQPA